MSRTPQLGANVMFSDAPELTEHYCKVLADHGMPVVRFFINTDFERQDPIFEAAAKHGIALCPTFPAPKDPERQATLDRLEETIAAIVERYKTHPALDTWILLNEPNLRLRRSELAERRLREWLVERYGSAEGAIAAWGGGGHRYASLDELVADEANWQMRPSGQFGRHVPQTDLLRFFVAYQTWYIGFLAACVRARDTSHPVHTNPDQLAGNLVAVGYDLPAWRESLDALGATLHPGWSFGRFRRRDRYALGFSYQCEVLRGSSEPHPFWITELQSGTNIYEGNYPLCPTAADMAQWTWVTIGAGAARAIYWCLNPRRAGREAGGWALLDYQDQPSERMAVTGEIARLVEERADFFREAAPVETPVTVLIGLEAMAVECFYDKQDFPGRSRDAHTESARGVYEALQELGIPARVKHLHDFEWNRASTSPQLAILPNLLAMSETQAARLTEFVKKGHTVLLTGQTGMYGEHAELWPNRSPYPLSELLGGTIRDMRFIDERFELRLAEPELSLPCHLLQGEIRNESGRVIATDGGRVTAARNRCGQGEAIWIPSLVGLGAWLYDSLPLASLLSLIAEPFARGLPFRFESRAPNCLMRVMRSGDRHLTVVANGAAERRQVVLVRGVEAAPTVLWSADARVSDEGTELDLGPRATACILWG